MKARLAHGIAHAAPWGVSLDGLLAAEIWADQKAGKRDRGEDVAALSADVDPEDLDLPLARCELSGGDLWHWAATCAYPEKPVDHPVVRYWTGRPIMRRSGISWQISRALSRKGKARTGRGACRCWSRAPTP